MYVNFDWPLPHYYEAAEEVETIGHEPATVRFLDGKALQGTLTRFLPSHGVLEFRPKNERANIDVQLTDIEQVQLERRLKLKPRTPGPELARRAGAAKPSEKQSFQIELTNGKIIASNTTGFDMRESGLFLYPTDPDSTVQRIFIPTSAIKRERIGPLIGETLIEQQIVTPAQVEQGLERQTELRDKRLGELLAEQKVISREQLHHALERARAMPVIRLGDALVELKMITREQLATALDLQAKNRKKPLGEILMELGFLSPVALERVMSQKLGIPFVELSRFDNDPLALKALPEELIRSAHVVPLCFDEGSLVVAMSNPLDPEPVERCRFYTQGQVLPVMASIEDIYAAIGSWYGEPAGERVESIAQQLRTELYPEASGWEQPIKETDNTLVRLVNKMILDAHASNASDIHVEANPGKTSMVIRFRKDGVLSDYLRLPHNFRSAMVSRLKIMANLDISEHRRAQDGRINFQEFGPVRVELRVVTMPTQDGLEDVVLRLLTMREPLPITKLGLRDEVLKEVRRLIQKPHGLMLVVGPTGSGKTTTLHSVISVINVPETKIWTAENPVEITQPGLRQVQVNAKIGWDFATIMRAFLRADPDVIMVGEMRDKETAGIGVEASLTGHLVFSTLHTNSAAETVVRLLDMDIDPFSFSDALLGVLAQRLARKLCLKCRTSRPATEVEIEALAVEYCGDTALKSPEVIAYWKCQLRTPIMAYAAGACEACRKTGYSGRMGLHELLVITPEIRQMMLRRAPAVELRDAGIRDGMRTLKQDGIMKCLLGHTDIHEVRAAAV